MIKGYLGNQRTNKCHKSHYATALTQEIYWEGRNIKGWLWVEMEKKGTRDQSGMDVKRVWCVHTGEICDHSNSGNVFHWLLTVMEQDRAWWSTSFWNVGSSQFNNGINVYATFLWFWQTTMTTTTYNRHCLIGLINSEGYNTWRWETGMVARTAEILYLGFQAIDRDLQNNGFVPCKVLSLYRFNKMLLGQ